MMSTDMPASDGDEPRFTRDTRVRIALSKFYGMDGDEWTIADIADHLNVTTERVESYIYDSDMAQDVSHMLDQRQATTRMKILEDLHAKVERLDEVEAQLAEEKKAVPNRYGLKEVTAEVDPGEYDGLETPEEGGDLVEVKVPVPEGYTEVPNIEELSDVWREKRLVQEQIEDLLGLEEPEEIKTESEQTVDVKHWEMSGDGLPEQDVVDVEGGTIEQDAIDE